jgi:hypothetical protein
MLGFVHETLAIWVFMPTFFSGGASFGALHSNYRCHQQCGYRMQPASRQTHFRIALPPNEFLAYVRDNRTRLSSCRFSLSLSWGDRAQRTRALRTANEALESEQKLKMNIKFWLLYDWRLWISDEVFEFLQATLACQSREWCSWSCTNLIFFSTKH